MINISSECPAQDLGPLVDYEKIHIPDLPTASIQIYFDRLVDRIEENLQQGKENISALLCRKIEIGIDYLRYVERHSIVYSFLLILAYLMKYRQMSLRDAFLLFTFTSIDYRTEFWVY